MSNPLDHVSDAAMRSIDVLAIVAAFGAFAKILPPLAAFMSVIWIAMQMFRFIEERIEKRKTPKI